MNVSGTTRQIGSLIDGCFILNTKNYEHKDLEDINRIKTIGINLILTPGVAGIYRNGFPTEEHKSGQSVYREAQSKEKYVRREVSEYEKRKQMFKK